MNRKKAIEELLKAKEILGNVEEPTFWLDFVQVALINAIELMKEQEAIKPYMDYDGQDVWRCGKCGNSLMHPSYYESDEDSKNYIRYCSHCGRKVKWDDGKGTG